MCISIRRDREIIELILDAPDKSANLLDRDFTRRFSEVLIDLENEACYKGIIVRSNKKDFLAGADLSMMLQAEHPEELMTWLGEFKAALRKLETFGKPVVALIEGSALGGGYELALACHHRIVKNSSSIRIGCPEVNFGLIPGAGGTQRLPRLIGVQTALPLLIEGRVFSPSDALNSGLIDKIAASEEEMMQLALAYIETNPDSLQPWDFSGTSLLETDPRSAEMIQFWAMAPAYVNQKSRGNYEAHRRILAAVHEGSLVDFDTASRIETRHLVSCMISVQAKNMIQAFWVEMNQIKKGLSRPPELPRKRFGKIGVLGAGMMGAGIAYAAAMKGVEVYLKDRDLESAEKGKDYSRKQVEKRVQKGRMLPAKGEELLARIHPAADMHELKDCELVIEAVFENRELKAEILKEIDSILPKEALIASNTSTLPISGLASYTQRETNFIGLHFFSPVEKMQLVEIIMGQNTSSEALAAAFDFVLQISKVPIVVKDGRGFYTSRVFQTYVLEGIAMVAEGEDPAKIESYALDAGMPVGPLALSDEVSLELMDRIITQTQKDLEAEGLTLPEHPGREVVDRMVHAWGRLGKKNSRGFYDYGADRTKTLWGEIETYFPSTEMPASKVEMQERFLFVQSIEALRCLEEGILSTEADGNIGSILGWGFAPFHGGVFRYVRSYGVEKFIIRSNEFRERYGLRFTPPRILENRELFPRS